MKYRDGSGRSVTVALRMAEPSRTSSRQPASITSLWTWVVTGMPGLPPDRWTSPRLMNRSLTLSSPRSRSMQGRLSGLKTVPTGPAPWTGPGSLVTVDLHQPSRRSMYTSTRAGITLYWLSSIPMVQTPRTPRSRYRSEVRWFRHSSLTNLTGGRSSTSRSGLSIPPKASRFHGYGTLLTAQPR